MTEIEHRVSKRSFTPEEATKIVKRLDFPAGPTGCWLWKGSIDDRDGYGYIWLSGERYSVHRLIYQRLKEDYDSDLEVGHLCGNPSCINPNHLKMQTQGENLADRVYGPPQSDAERKRKSRAKARERKVMRPLILAVIRKEIREYQLEDELGYYTQPQDYRTAVSDLETVDA